MSEPRRLRILHCFRAPVGGVFRHVRDLAMHQSAAGHAVGMLCDSSASDAFGKTLFDNVRPHLELGITRLPIRRRIGPGDVAAIYGASRDVARLQPDILHGHGAKGGVLARVIGRRLRFSGVRVARLYSPHGGSLHYSASSPSGRAYFAAERFLERWTEALIFVSDYERRVYSDKIGIPDTDWRIIRNGLDADEFARVPVNADAADFLFVGTMRDLKGPDVFIRAFAAAERHAGRPLSAVMIGDGDDKPRYEAMLGELGLSERITMLPAMTARQAFRLGRIMCVPSRAEAMPYIVLETLAAGKPLIASRVGGIPEILGDDCAALVPPDDVETLAKTLALAADDADWLHGAMPDAERFQSEFSADAMAENVMTLYRRCRTGNNL